MKRIVITATPPTPNGDLHIGHLSGPYLNADVYARYVRLHGDEPLYVSFSDHNQTYVVTTAARNNEVPMALADRYADGIRETLSMANIQTGTFHNPDERHSAFVQGFFSELFAKGKLKKKTKPVLVNAATGEHVFESYLKGHCTVCFSETSGAICEACGHPNDATTIDSPRVSLAPDLPLELREMELVYLEIEEYREQIKAFYDVKRGTWRPHLIALVDELLSKPLADYPVTYRSSWGIPAPFPGCQGQVLNVWAEMFPGLVNAANLVAEREVNSAAGTQAATSGWNGKSQVVQFLGYDNSYFFALVHLALAFASENKYAPPAFIVTNEFYELDNFKFSTSKRHVIWGRDILKDVPTDLLRYYLCLSNPEGQKMKFTLTGFRELTEKRLQAPWQSLLSNILESLQAHDLNTVELPRVSSSARGGIYGQAQARFAHFYAVEHFSLQGVAENFSQLLSWAANRAQNVRGLPSDAARRELADLLRLIGWTIPLVASAVMPSFADDVRRHLQLPTVQRWDEEPDAHVVRVADLTHLQRLLAF
jgi:methionyl-tRNA synthetase